MRKSVYALGLAGVTAGVGALVFRLTESPLLSAVTGLVWAGCVVAFVFVYRRYPSSASGGEWKSSRWTGMGVLMVNTAALLGVSPFLSIDDGTRFGIQVLILGAGFGGYITGVLTEAERGEGKDS